MFRSGLLCMREIEIYAQRLNLSVSYQELPYLKPAPLSPCPPGCSPGRGQPRLALIIDLHVVRGQKRSQSWS